MIGLRIMILKNSGTLLGAGVFFDSALPQQAAFLPVCSVPIYSKAAILLRIAALCKKRGVAILYRHLFQDTT